ncbi:hypothetical protein FRC20_010750 [Serendipita sp. 405]|nr:hypothetical protein FRC20_010750 [Serendipita sp. 405]
MAEGRQLLNAPAIREFGAGKVPEIYNKSIGSTYDVLDSSMLSADPQNKHRAMYLQ